MKSWFGLTCALLSTEYNKVLSLLWEKRVSPWVKKSIKCSVERINRFILQSLEKKIKISTDGNLDLSFNLTFVEFVLRWTLLSLFCWWGPPAVAVWLWRACTRCTLLPVGSGPPSARFYGNKTTNGKTGRALRTVQLRCDKFRIFSMEEQLRKMSKHRFYLPFCLKNCSSNSFRFLRSLFFSSRASWSCSTSSCL